jgi:hypothetical protein
MKWHFFFISVYLLATFVHSSDDVHLIILLAFMFEWVFVEKMWVRWGKRRELRTVNLQANESGSQVFVIEFPINPKRDKWLLWNPGDCIGVVCELINQEEHIFTIASSPYSGKLRLCIQITHGEPERDINPLIARNVKQWTTIMGKKIRRAIENKQANLFLPFLLSPPLPTHSGIYTKFNHILFITSGTGLTPGLATLEHYIYTHANQYDKKTRSYMLIRLYRTHKSMEWSDKIFLSWEAIAGTKWTNGTLNFKNLSVTSVGILSGETQPVPDQYKDTALRLNLTGAKDESRDISNQKKVAAMYMLIKAFSKQHENSKEWKIFFCGAEAVAKLAEKAAWLNGKSVVAEMF